MDKNNCQYYTYAEHRFRFAAWAAIGAVKRNMSSPVRKTNGKPAEGELTNIIIDIFEEIGFYEIAGKDNWLLKIKDFDIQHASWRKRIRELAKEKRISHGTSIKKEKREIGGYLREKESMSHGLAAKLINIFIKTLMPPDLYSVSPELQKRWCKVHPPIDGILLRKMDTCGFGNGNVNWVKQYHPWTKLTSCQYQELIDNIRYHDKPNCLWKIERFWKP